MALDASLVDVYKGTHAVIFMINVTKKWTLQYFEDNLPNVPPNMPILVLVCCRDFQINYPILA